MCVVSNVMDDWTKRWPQTTPETPWIPNTWPPVGIPDPEVSREEFEALKEEVESLKKLLKAAKIYDEETGQPDCEIEEKVELIKKIAEALDIDLDGIL